MPVLPTMKCMRIQPWCFYWHSVSSWHRRSLRNVWLVSIINSCGKCWSTNNQTLIINDPRASCSIQWYSIAIKVFYLNHLLCPGLHMWDMSAQSQRKPAKWLLNRYLCEHLIFTQSSLLKWPKFSTQRDTAHICKHFTICTIRKTVQH